MDYAGKISKLAYCSVAQSVTVEWPTSKLSGWLASLWHQMYDCCYKASKSVDKLARKSDISNHDCC